MKPAIYKGASCFTLTPDGKWLIRCDLTWGKGALQVHPVKEKSRGVKFAEGSPEFTAVAASPDGAGMDRRGLAAARDERPRLQ